MKVLKLLADMNIAPVTVVALDADGWDVFRVSDVLPEDASDTRILTFARDEQRVIITQDLDFSALLAIQGYARPSLISPRLSDPSPVNVTRRLVKVLPESQDALLKGAAITIQDKSVRTRSLPIR